MLSFPDISEYQSVDWNRFTSQAVIVRAHNGFRTDRLFGDHQAGARAHAQLVGYYQYLVATVAPETQARAFLAVVGKLQPNEFYVLDSEGQDAGMVQWQPGQQADYSRRWLAVVDPIESRLSLVYSNLSGLALGVASNHPIWVARPGTDPRLHAEVLWQNGYAPFGGMVGSVDANYFGGTVADLSRLLGLGTTVAPTTNVPAAPLAPPVNYPEDHMQSVSITIPFGNQRGWVSVPGGDASKVVNVVVQEQAPSVVGTYVPVPSFVGAASNGEELLFGPSPYGATPDGNYGATVWLATA